MAPESEWDDAYRDARPEDLPWFSNHVDPDTEETIRKLHIGPQDGPILDLGTGPGTFAIHYAKLGYHVVALDISAHALRMARQRAGAWAARVEWVEGDLHACDWPNRFALIHDRGVYHSMPRDARDLYAQRVPGWLRPGGHLLLKTFSPEEPGTWGPFRIPKDELVDNFGRAIAIQEIVPAVFGDSQGSPHAWRLVARARRPR